MSSNRRWLISIVYASLAGAQRFNEFRQAVEGISPKTLSDRLVELELQDPQQLRAMCEKLLANPLVEDYELQLLDGDGAAE